MLNAQEKGNKEVSQGWIIYPQINHMLGEKPSKLEMQSEIILLQQRDVVGINSSSKSQVDPLYQHQ